MKEDHKKNYYRSQDGDAQRGLATIMMAVLEMKWQILQKSQCGRK